MGSLRGTIRFPLQRLSLSLSLWGPSPLGAISSRPTPSGARSMKVCSSLTAQPPLATHPHRPTPPIFHTLPHFPELAMPSSRQAFGPAGPCACKTHPLPLCLANALIHQVPASLQDVRPGPQGPQCSSAPPSLERPQRSTNHAVSCLPPVCVLHPTVNSQCPDAWHITGAQ